MFRIYQITNLVNQKKYIGITRVPQLRWWAHKNAALVRNRRHSLAVAIREFGESNFRFEVINAAETRDEAFDLEKLYISLLRSDQPDRGYNMTGGGFGLFQNPEYKRRLSEGVRELSADPVRGPEWKKRLSEGKKRAYAADPTYRHRVASRPSQFKGKLRGQQTKDKIRAAALLRGPMPEEQKARIAASMKGKNSYRRSEATRKRMSEAWRLRLQNPDNHQQMSDAQKNSAKALASINDPERRKRHSEFMKAIWARRRAERKAS